jgi:hypothetical protein
LIIGGICPGKKERLYVSNPPPLLRIPLPDSDEVERAPSPTRLNEDVY